MVKQMPAPLVDLGMLLERKLLVNMAGRNIATIAQKHMDLMLHNSVGMNDWLTYIHNKYGGFMPFSSMKVVNYGMTGGKTTYKEAMRWASGNFMG